MVEEEDGESEHFFLADLLSDDEMDPRRAEALKKVGPISKEIFIQILEKTAPGNPYAEGLLESMKKKQSEK